MYCGEAHSMNNYFHVIFGSTVEVLFWIQRIFSWMVLVFEELAIQINININININTFIFLPIWYFIYLFISLRFVINIFYALRFAT